MGLHFRFDKMKIRNAERLPIYSSADVDWLASVELQYFPLLARSGGAQPGVCIYFNAG